MATPWRRWSLSSQILFGIAVGAAVGLFFGERVSFLQVVADAYIRLLQMTVLPYVTVAIIIGLGSLDAKQARALGTRVGVIILLVWAVALLMVVLFPLMFPQNQNASFFSAALVEERETFDFLGLYIPTNPFNSLANNIVPSVVLFSVVVGAALIANPHKRRLLDVLDVAANAISKATNFIVKLTPYGVFAIGAVVAGTLRIEELERLQVYLITYVAMSLVISLWVLPALVATMTPVPYRALMSRNRNALVLAFMTTSLFAVLPLIIEETKALLRDYANVDGGEQDAATDVIVPATFNFPHTGKLLSLSFILFAGWFSDRSVPVTEYPRLAGTGVLVLFGNVNAAIPYLLDLFRIPADTFRLFVTSGIVNARFGTLVAAVHTLAIAVLGTCAMTGTLRVDARKLVRFAAITGILLVIVVGGSRFVLQEALHRPYDKDTILTGMRMTRDRGTARVYKLGEAVPPLPPVTSSVLDRVRQRGILRVGYFDDSLPFAFFNSHGELVGLDVEMALQLARDLGVKAEFVPIDRAQLDAGLDPAACDLVMSGAVIMADRAAKVQYSVEYLLETIAFVVPDHLTSAFSDWSSIKAMGRLRLGVPRAPYFMQKIRDELGDVDIVPIDRMDELFAPHDPPLDAGVATAERGSAYTLLHPDYSVAVPKPRLLKVPLAYIVAGRDSAMVSMINTWIELKRADGTIDELFSYWILGQNPTARAPRWSIIHDVLGWR
ncbi:MAG TPA: cation:dicarboxylase symporter family transporter [Vicinamibacterales bacterium]